MLFRLNYRLKKDCQGWLCLPAPQQQMMKWLQLPEGEKHTDTGNNEAGFLTPAVVLLILLTVIAVNYCSSLQVVVCIKDT